MNSVFNSFTIVMGQCGLWMSILKRQVRDTWRLNSKAIECLKSGHRINVIWRVSSLNTVLSIAEFGLSGLQFICQENRVI